MRIGASRPALFAAVLAVTAALIPTPAAHAAAAIPCTNGSAGGYPCKNVDLLANVPLSSMGGGSGSGGWGWTDPATGKEYAIAARSNGTAFVDISNPTSPVYLGNLPSPTGTSSWREVNVYANHLYVVSDNNGSHGLQIFDLTRLRNVTAPPVTFTSDARNTSFTRAHTVTINYDTGFAYINGSSTCSGGPRMFSLADPKAPAFAGCLSADGYTHDGQCVRYHGPDTRYQGREVCFNSNEDTLTLFDVTTKTSPVQLARKGYAGSGYVHQGWLTENQRYFLLDDETDETSDGHNSYTYVWDVADLTNPVLLGHFTGPTAATDHNQFVKGNYSYQSNYKAGLRIIDLTNVANPTAMTEAAYFDVYPANNANGFNGTWTNYPYYPSGNVAVFSVDRGLFVVRPNLGTPSNDFSIAASPSSGSVNPGGSTTTTTSTAVTSGTAQTVNLSAAGLPAGAIAAFNPPSVTAGGSSTLTLSTAATTPAGTYTVRVTGTGAAATHSTSYQLTVAPTGGGLVNGGFETGTLSGWTAVGTTAVTTSGPHSGTSAANIGATPTPTTGDSSISQTFTAPAGAATVAFWYNVTCLDTVTYDWATATLRDNTTNTTTTVLAKTCTNGQGWKQASSAVIAGRSYTLTLISHDDDYAGDGTAVKYDDVTIS